MLAAREARGEDLTGGVVNPQPGRDEGAQGCNEQPEREDREQEAVRQLRAQARNVMGLELPPHALSDACNHAVRVPDVALREGGARMQQGLHLDRG